MMTLLTGESPNMGKGNFVANCHISLLFVCFEQLSLYRVALSVYIYITALPRGPVDGVSAGVPPHRVYTLLFTIECDGFFNVQRACLAVILWLDRSQTTDPLFRRRTLNPLSHTCLPNDLPWTC